MPSASVAVARFADPESSTFRPELTEVTPSRSYTVPATEPHGPKVTLIIADWFKARTPLANPRKPVLGSRDVTSTLPTVMLLTR